MPKTSCASHETLQEIQRRLRAGPPDGEMTRALIALLDAKRGILRQAGVPEEDADAWLSEVVRNKGLDFTRARNRRRMTLLDVDEMARVVLCGWFRSAHDAAPHPELRDCIERNPRLFTTDMALAPFVCWRVHEVAPTVAGWKSLAANPFGFDVTPSPASFGVELDVAVDTLEAALAEEREGAGRVALARWLLELRGAS